MHYQLLQLTSKQDEQEEYEQIGISSSRWMKLCNFSLLAEIFCLVKEKRKEKKRNQQTTYEKPEQRKTNEKL